MGLFGEEEFRKLFGDEIFGKFDDWLFEKWGISFFF